jgi:hypothetical protein
MTLDATAQHGTEVKRLPAIIKPLANPRFQGRRFPSRSLPNIALPFFANEGAKPRPERLYPGVSTIAFTDWGLNLWRKL